MKRGIYVPPMATFGDVHLMVELATSAESAGWDGFFLWDHIRYERPVPFVDPWVTLAAVATATNRLAFGALITPLARRRPHKVAREIVTLDHLSGGRAVLGVGLGIDFWGEYSAFDEPLTDDRARARALDDGIAKVKRYLDGDLLPAPVNGRIPIWCAAGVPFRDAPIRRAGALDGVMPWSFDGNTTPEMMRAARDLIGRDDSYDYVVAGDSSRAEEYEAAGVTWLLESFWPEAPVDRARKTVAAGPSR